MPEDGRPESEITTQLVPDVPQRNESGNLEGKVALITNDDAGLSRSTALTFARAGADVAIIYRYEQRDAEEIKQLVEAHGRRCLLIPGDDAQENFAHDAVQKTVAAFGKIDILVNQDAKQ